MNSYATDEDYVSTLRALHERVSALEASFFSKAVGAVKKAAASVKGDDMSPRGLAEHLKAAFPGMRSKAINEAGAESKWLLAINGKTFLIKEMHMAKLVGNEWVFMKDPNILKFDEKNVDARVSSYKAVDDYIRMRAP